MGDAELAGQSYLESPPAIGRTRSSSADPIVCTVQHLFVRSFDPTHLFGGSHANFGAYATRATDVSRIQRALFYQYYR